jgi:cytochrome P450/NADPH-cytochrome P450 reductase
MTITQVAANVILQGRPFAWQEIHLALASIFQKFDLVAADPASYKLHIQSTLTIKAQVQIRAVPRAGRSAHALFPAPSSGLQQAREDNQTSSAPPITTTTTTATGKEKQPMYILYGSNTGTCESFARKIATAAPSHGMSHLVI